MEPPSGLNALVKRRIFASIPVVVALFVRAREKPALGFPIDTPIQSAYISTASKIKLPHPTQNALLIITHRARI